MKFTEWIDDEKYNKYRKLCEIYSSKWASNSNDVLSLVFDRFLVKNPEIKTNDNFHALFLTELKWALLTEKKNQSKVSILSTSETVCEEISSEPTKEDEAVLKVLKNSHYAGIYKWRYIHGLTKVALCKKYKLTERQLNKKLKAIEDILKESSHNQHKGIARLISGKIDKVYCNIKAVEEDGFLRSSVSKVVSGKLATFNHKGFEWRYVADLKKD